MVAGPEFVVMDTLAKHHAHEYTHIFSHTHNGITHTHTVVAIALSALDKKGCFSSLALHGGARRNNAGDFRLRRNPQKSDIYSTAALLASILQRDPILCQGRFLL